jgi:hypothetical protein
LRTRWRKIVGTAVAVIILFFIVRSLRSGLATLGSYRFDIDVWRVIGAFGLFAVLFPAYGKVWQYLLGKFGYSIGFARSMKIWFYSQAGRYIPGKVWFALGRIYLCEREGIPRSVAAVAMALELAIVIGSALVVFGVASAVSPALSGTRYLYGLWLVPAIVVAVHPRIIRTLLGKLRRAPVEVNIGYGDILKILGVYVVNWCIYGIGFYLVATSLRFDGSAVESSIAQGSDVLPGMVGINAVSWVGGLLSVITPAGLGVREGISTVLLSRILAGPYPSLIPLAARIWVTVAELGTIGFLLLVRGSK